MSGFSEFQRDRSFERVYPAVLAARKYGGGEGEVVVFALRRDI